MCGVQTALLSFLIEVSEFPRQKQVLLCLFVHWIHMLGEMQTTVHLGAQLPEGLHLLHCLPSQPQGFKDGVRGIRNWFVSPSSTVLWTWRCRVPRSFPLHYLFTCPPVQCMQGSLHPSCGLLGWCHSHTKTVKGSQWTLSILNPIKYPDYVPHPHSDVSTG